MANSWGELSWSTGLFGEQNNTLAQPEGISLSSSLGDVTINIIVTNGWGALTWGSTDWGINTGSPTTQVTGQSLTSVLNNDGVSISLSPNVSLTGQQLTSLSPGFQTSFIQNVSGTSDNIFFAFRPNEASKIQYVGAGWNVVGQPTFIVTAVSLDPNDQYTGTITITGGTFVSGQSYSFESPNVNITGTANLTLDTNLATLSQGNAQGIPGVVVSVTAPGTATTWGSNGWGQLGWGENIGLTTLEGTATVDLITPVNVTGQLLSTSLNSVTISATGNLSLTGQVLTAEVSSVGITADGSVSIPVFENPLVTALGNVDPGPDANITGQQLTLTQGDIDIDIAVVVQVTGQLLSTSLNSVTIDLNTPVSITGQNLTTAINSVTIATNTPVNLTGNNLTGRTGQLYVAAWAPVDTGQSIAWTEVAA
jgi:hypothetical protein